MFKPGTQAVELLVAVVSALFLTALTMTNASAAFLYSYTGNPLVVEAGSDPGGLDRITFTMIGNLGANRAIEYSEPSPQSGLIYYQPFSWSISDGLKTFSSASLYPNLETQFAFATNSAGAIYDWYVLFVTRETYNAVDLTQFAQITTNYAFRQIVPGPCPDNCERFAYEHSVGCISYPGCDLSKDPIGYRATTLDTPGTWTMTEVPDPPPGANEIPEPSTLALIAMALMSMFGFGMVRRRADA